MYEILFWWVLINSENKENPVQQIVNNYDPLDTNILMATLVVMFLLIFIAYIQINIQDWKEKRRKEKRRKESKTYPQIIKEKDGHVCIMDNFGGSLKFSVEEWKDFESEIRDEWEDFKKKIRDELIYLTEDSSNKIIKKKSEIIFINDNFGGRAKFSSEEWNNFKNKVLDKEI